MLATILSWKEHFAAPRGWKAGIAEEKKKKVRDLFD